jgi:hypothetical protein
MRLCRRCLRGCPGGDHRRDENIRSEAPRHRLQKSFVRPIGNRRGLRIKPTVDDALQPNQNIFQTLKHGPNNCHVIEAAPGHAFSSLQCTVIRAETLAFSAQSLSNFGNDTPSASAIRAITMRLGFRRPRSIPPR